MAAKKKKSAYHTMPNGKRMKGSTHPTSKKAKRKLPKRGQRAATNKRTRRKK